MKKSTTQARAAIREMIEPLEARIAPATVAVPLLSAPNIHYVSVTLGTPQLLTAGDVLSTSGQAGAYLLYVQAGQCEVFTNDLNNNHSLDPNEITGIAAGNGLKLICFCDINGDIVTDLNANGTLTDSDNNSATGPAATNGHDGAVLLPSRIVSITMRSLTAADLPEYTTNPTQAAIDVVNRLEPTTYSIYGSIIAGGGLGDLTNPATIATTANGTTTQAPNPAADGLLFDTTGYALQALTTTDDPIQVIPQVGSILIGTAASGAHFNFGSTQHNILPQGVIQTFTPAPGVAGGGIYNVRAANISMQFDVDTFHAGDGGFGAAGGSIVNVTMNGDSTGYTMIAGNGGTGLAGGVGGNITNFSDLGSTTTADVLLRAGDGGQGLTGAGGAGGIIGLGTADFTGNITMKLGSGGDGFSAGGKGASLSTATILNVSPTSPTAVDLVSTTRDLDLVNLTGTVVPSIGQVQLVDFTGDGSTDAVFTTTNPNKIEVVFGVPGDPGIFDPNHILLLEGPADAHVAIADVNNDGKPDIIAISGLATGGGLYVYLNEGNGNFSLPLESPLPTLGSYGYYRSPLTFTNIAAGDFNGDGLMDIALVASYQAQTVNGPVAHHVAIFMDGIQSQSTNATQGSGYFAADFASTAVLQSATNLNNSINPIQNTAPFFDLGKVSNGPEVIKPTASTGNSTYDILLAGYVGDTKFVELDNSPAQVLQAWSMSESNSASPPSPNNTAGPVYSTFALGKVDTNRAVSTISGTPPNTTITSQVSLQQATLLDIAVLDIDSDNYADVVVLTDQPTSYLVAFKGSGGTGAGNWTLATDNPNLSNSTNYGRVANDNSGIYLGANGGAIGGPDGNNLGGLNLTDLATMSIRATHAEGDGVYDDIAVLDYRDSTTYFIRVIEVELISSISVPTPAYPTGYYQVEGAFSNSVLFPTPQTLDTTILAWDLVPAASTNVGYGMALPVSGGLYEPVVFFEGNGVSGAYDLSDYGLHVFAGDGGNSVVGPGGAGGYLGGKFTTVTTVNPTTGLSVTTVTGSILVTLPTSSGNINFFNGSLDFTSGTGGDGFTTGGSGGNIQAVDVNYVAGTTVFSSDVTLTAGSGGFGLTGAGGNGGSLVSNSIITGSVFTAGDGGNGMTGGNGGSIVGNGSSTLYDAGTAFMQAHAGAGAHGITAAGHGGSVTNFRVEYFNHLAIGITETLDYEAGSGGSAVAGPGGAGGSLTSDSPATNVNNMDGEIYLLAGMGGSGLTGGAGGSITSFINSPQANTVPTILSVLAGDGGNSVTGAGAAGGSIASVTATVQGTQGTISEYPYTRILSGNGGDSYGSSGGAGGSITSVNSTSQSSSVVAAAGRGGDGLTTGGAGGSVLSTTLNASGNIANPAVATSGYELLVVAGDGGDTYASLATPMAAFSAQLGGPVSTFGKVNGHAGNGGGINNFTQPISTDTRVNLIAGNGGSTVNYGTSTTVDTGIGVGGSITNISIRGTIGNVSPYVPIKAYNDLNDDGTVDETMGTFIDSFFRNSLTPGAALDDSVGNVGLVAGASGRVRDDQPSLMGVNGSVSNVTASSIMSMVAGSVDSIAAIQSISNIVLTDPTIPLGSDKADPNNGNALGTLDYYDQNGNEIHTGPALGDRLLDGAIVAHNLGGLTGQRVFLR